MPSPFPGIDPWLESPAMFPDLHNRFITHLSEALNAVFPPPYYAAIANRVWVEEFDRRIETDANVLKPQGSNGHPAGGASGVATLALPGSGLLTIPAESPADEPMEEAYLEVHASPGGKGWSRPSKC